MANLANGDPRWHDRRSCDLIEWSVADDRGRQVDVYGEGVQWPIDSDDQIPAVKVEGRTYVGVDNVATCRERRGAGVGDDGAGWSLRAVAEEAGVDRHERSTTPGQVSPAGGRCVAGDAWRGSDLLTA